MHRCRFIPALSVFLCHYFLCILAGRGGLIVRLIFIFSCILECFKKISKKNLNNFIVKR